MPAPNKFSVVQQVSEHFPGLIVRDPHAFTNAVAYTLWQQDNRWGHNVKRGSQGLSEDAICYLGDDSPLKTRGGQGIYIFDIIGSAGSPNASPAWIDQTGATLAKGETGAWSQPHPPTGGHVEPAPVPAPPPAPQPPRVEPTPPTCKCDVTSEDIGGIYEVILELAVKVAQGHDRTEALTLNMVGHMDDIKQRIEQLRQEVAAKPTGECRMPRWR